jgi:hypothetical protein
MEAEPCATSAEAIAVQLSRRNASGRLHLGTDGKVGQGEPTRFGREFAETGCSDSGADSGISESIGS